MSNLRRVGVASGVHRQTVAELRQSRMPGWMVAALAGAAVASLAATAIVLFGPMDERVAATGVVRPAGYALVFPSGSGVVTELHSAPGESVRTGDLLARLDTRACEHERRMIAHQLARAEADLAEAQARTTTAIPPELTLQAAAAPRLGSMVAERRRLLDRMESGTEGQGLSLLELVRERLVFSSLELEHERAQHIDGLLKGPWAEATRTAAAARVSVAEAELAGLRARRTHLDGELERCAIRAPVDGVLVSRAIRFAGERAEIGVALFKIATGQGSRLRLYAGEDRIDRIHPGQQVLFRPRSDPDRLRKPRVGTVTAVAIDRDLGSDESDRPPEGAYAVDVTLSADESALPLGASVEAEIVLGQRSFLHLLLTRPAARP